MLLDLLQVVFTNFAVNVEHFVELATLSFGLLAVRLALVHEILEHVLWIDVLFQAASRHAAIFFPAIFAAVEIATITATAKFAIFTAVEIATITATVKFAIFAAVEIATITATTSSILALKFAFLHPILHLAIDDARSSCRHQKALRVNINFATELLRHDKLSRFLVVALNFDAVNDAELFVGSRFIPLFCAHIFALEQPLLDLFRVDSVAVHVEQVSFAVAPTGAITLGDVHNEPAIGIVAAFNLGLIPAIIRDKFVLLRLHKSLLLHEPPLLLAVGDIATADAISMPVEQVALLVAPLVRVLPTEARLSHSIAFIDYEITAIVVLAGDFLASGIFGFELVCVWVELRAHSKPIPDHVIGDTCTVLVKHEAILVASATHISHVRIHDEVSIFVVAAAHPFAVIINAICLILLWASISALADSIFHGVIDNPLSILI